MDICSFFFVQQSYNDVPVRLRQEARQTLSLVDLDLIEQILQRDESRLLHQLLSPAELCYFQRFKYMKRKKEWLGGRIAGKAAILAPSHANLAAQELLSSIAILPNRYGRPIAEQLPASLAGQGDEPVISLSHSDGFAVALARKGRNCGIDLQEISPRLVGLTSHFAREAELQRLAEQVDYNEDTHLTMLWTVKEALKKALLHDQSVIFSETELLEISRVNESVWRFTCAVQEKNQSVLVHFFSPYILSITEEEKHA
ncbi:MAG: 4'-phosphopantetheinyl transferase superfamily protein [Candidatus Electrothrix sp. GW3-4]|uniref:4'-phosphopantetheinyl transferase family protein n=1 Tax=Candidatus Electrothrix sp. GW3-4 TaxID=3126740 RepID=UPI0030D18FFF